ncbi:conserved hypothetical protein [Microcystis aeruginosa PCC 7941]|nr:conserved hypothetical protein [Microcystis aeruginosa PCC 7941]
MKKIHQLPSGVSIQESVFSIQETGDSETGDSETISIYSPHTPHPTPHTPHPN